MTGTGIVKVVCGCGVGRTVGTMVGTTVGATVGAGVETTAGSTVGSGVGVVLRALTGVGVAPVSASTGWMLGWFGVAYASQPPASKPVMTMPAARATRPGRLKNDRLRVVVVSVISVASDERLNKFRPSDAPNRGCGAEDIRKGRRR